MKKRNEKMTSKILSPEDMDKRFDSHIMKNQITGNQFVEDRREEIRLKGDFTLNEYKLSKEENNEFIYTGCQILNRQIFSSIKKSIFSMNEVWDDLLNRKELYGYESSDEFLHLTDIEIFEKLN